MAAVFQLSASDLSRLRTSTLQKLLVQGREGEARADAVFAELLKTDSADIYQCRVMLETAEHQGFSDLFSSSELKSRERIRRILSQMHRAGVSFPKLTQRFFQV
jgi:hypothetical protein